METTTQAVPISNTKLWIGRALSLLPALFMLHSSGNKLFSTPFVTEMMAGIGYPQHLTLGFGIVLLACVVLYLVPRTSILGAVLLTGYLGGAIAAEIRVGAPLFLPLFLLALGLMIWGGLYLRDYRLRVLMPLNQKDEPEGRLSTVLT
jgi:hypothetical protein